MDTHTDRGPVLAQLSCSRLALSTSPKWMLASLGASCEVIPVSSRRIASLIGFIMMVAAMVLLLTERQLIAESRAGCAAQVAAALLMIWARTTFGRRSFHPAANPTEGELVTDGPYRFLRHPIYAAILLFVFAALIDRRSLITVAAFAITLAGALLRILAEERLLRARYPEYAGYAQRTKRLAPFIY